MSRRIMEVKSCMSMPARRIRTVRSCQMGAEVSRDVPMAIAVTAVMVGVVLSDSSARGIEMGPRSHVGHGQQGTPRIKQT